jgi:hypothetical protein
MPKTEAAVGQPAVEAPLERKIVDYARVGVPVATVAVALIAGFTLGPPSAVLVLAGGALIGVIATFWASVRTLLGETPLSGADAYALGAPRAEEEQKRAVLRALKDLEFERSVGKIGDDDYQMLVSKYRAEAKRLLRLLDTEAEPARREVESLVNRRLRTEGLIEGGPDEEAPAEALADEAATGKGKGKGKKAKRRERELAAERERKAEADRELAAQIERELAAENERAAEREAELAVAVVRAGSSKSVAADARTDTDTDARADADADAGADADADAGAGADTDTRADADTGGDADRGARADVAPPASDDDEIVDIKPPAQDEFADTEPVRTLKVSSNRPAPLRMKARADRTTACASCGTMNDDDAVFCKKCGTRRDATESARKEDA